MLRSFPRPSPFLLAWIPRGAQRAAYLAALALVAIQVSIGIIMKISQTDGKYTFSPSASVTISEFLKMCLSLWFFYSECKQRAIQGIRPSTRGYQSSGYDPIPDSGLPMSKKSELAEDSDSASDKGLLESSGNASISFGVYWSYLRGEVREHVRYGFCNLALFYVLINNSIFISYKLADPGTIQLTKAGVSFITALVMITFTGANISKVQWSAIAIQVCGLMVTQYNPTAGTTYSLGTYLLLFVQVFLSASSGVYNQILLNSDESSLHADNAILYAAGSVTNLMIHLVLSCFKADEPGFFEGYTSFGAIMIIVSNVFIGLAITAVYKYADAVIKCFATACATGILLYISPILFGTKLSFLVLPGTVVVFTASWLYMDNPAPKAVNPQPVTTKGKSSLQSLLERRRLVLTAATFFTIFASVFLAMFSDSMGDVPSSQLKTKTAINSPFQNTLAMVRWNSEHPERLPYIRKYDPFFHTVHISMPKSLPDQTPEFRNISHDQYENIFTIYNEVANTMQTILDQESKVDGLLYFHFDAWIDPLAWNSWNKDNIWYASTKGGPLFTCMNDTSKYDWWGWNEGFHGAALKAVADVPTNKGWENFARDEWCLGWSDIYFIPRRLFKDFIELSKIFGKFGVMHEVAIPTMLHIIDRSRRQNSLVSIIDRFGDCWGTCCDAGATEIDVTWSRCGHKLDYLNEPVTNAFYRKLDLQASKLNKTTA